MIFLFNNRCVPLFNSRFDCRSSTLKKVRYDHNRAIVSNMKRLLLPFIARTPERTLIFWYSYYSHNSGVRSVNEGCTIPVTPKPNVDLLLRNYSNIRAPNIQAPAGVRCEEGFFPIVVEVGRRITRSRTSSVMNSFVRLI